MAEGENRRDDLLTGMPGGLKPFSMGPTMPGRWNIPSAPWNVPPRQWGAPGGGEGPGAGERGFGGSRGPGPGARGPENAATHAVDLGFGLAASGLLGPLAGAAFAAAVQKANPQATPSTTSFLGSLLGIGGGLGGPTGAEGWGNIGTTGDPGARDFSADPNRGLGSQMGGGSGLGGNSDGSGSTSGTGRGTGTGSGTGEGGSERGDYARGGIVKGTGGTDSQTIHATPGEGVLNPGAMRMLGPHTLFMLNAMGRGR